MLAHGATFAAMPLGHDLSLPPTLESWLKSPLETAKAKSSSHHQHRHSTSAGNSINSALPDMASSETSLRFPVYGSPPTKMVVPKDVGVCSMNGSTSRDTQSDFNVHRHARNGKNVIIGPMPVVAFLDEFLPPMPNGRPMPKPLGAFLRVPRKAKNEKTISDTLVDAINRGKRCPSVNFCSLGDTSDDGSSLDIRPGICGYSQADMHLATGRRTQPNLGLAEISFVVKTGHDPFCDSHPHTKSAYKSFFAFENREYEEEEDVGPGRLEKQNLGQCVAHAVEVCMRQHRLFYFSVLVIGTRARLFRWDRAGGIVTKAFDFRSQPELMCEFLWRFHCANLVQRGFDPTVSVASQAEEELFRKLVRQHAALQLGISDDNSGKLDNALSQHYEKGKVTKVSVYKRGCSTPDFHLVSVPLSCPKSLSGHATRAYWSVKVTGQNEGVVCFLKDTWRLDLGSTEGEGAVYEEMKSVKVENVCDIDCYGDIPDGLADGMSEQALQGYNDPEENPASTQRSRTQEFTDSEWVCECLQNDLNARISQHTHSRIALSQAGYSLRTFTGSRELFGAARDALRALESAFSRCRRVHRDISLDNIVLYRSKPTDSRQGLLVDWEFSSKVDSSGCIDDGLRSGTWAFMSANSLYSPRDFRHTIADDLESLFYVVLYGSVRWLPHDNLSYLGPWMRSFFYEVRPGTRGPTKGGGAKLLEINLGGSDFLESFSFENQFVQDWLTAAYKLLGTTFEASRNADQPCRWTMETLREILAIACEGLAQMDETTCDRTEHVLEGYADESRGSLDTRISLFTAARNFRKHHEALRKRSLEETLGDGVEIDSMKPRASERRSLKRRRVIRQDHADSAKQSDTKETGDKSRTRNESSRNLDKRSSGSSDNDPRRLSRRTHTSFSRGTRRSPRLQAKLKLSGSPRSRQYPGACCS